MGMTLADIQRLLGVAKDTLAAMRRDGRLPAPIPGTEPARWDAATIHAAIVSGELMRRKAGRPKGAKNKVKGTA